MKIERFTENYQGEEFDVIIIGGGITGASVAYEAATRGLSVALVEKNDYASATSSATSKMIHGGLRYLATGEIGLVRESLRERRLLSMISPNFVYPLPFIMTSYRGDKVSPFALKIGMWLYEILSFDKNRVSDPSEKLPSYKNLTAAQVLEMEPKTKKEGLLGASIYYDCADHSPERLVLAFLKSAIKYGAKTANYAEMKSYIIENQGNKKDVKGIVVEDKLTGKTIEIKAKLVINCSGPWADILLGRAKNVVEEDKHIRRSEGIHFVYDQIVENNALTCVTKHNKHFFVIPYRHHTLIGTTDQEYKGDPDKYRVTKKALQGLVNTINEYYGFEIIEYDKIRFAYGGLRPLVEDQTEEVYKSSRKYAITDEKRNNITGLMTIEGGKYTTSRGLAENAIDKAFKMLNMPKVKSVSKTKFLYGSEIPDFMKFVEDNKQKYPQFNQRQALFMSRMYGTELDAIMKIAMEKPEYNKAINEDGENLACVVYALRNESAYTLLDLLIRRTGIAQLGHPGAEIIKAVADLAQAELGWDSDRKAKEIEIVEKRLSLPQD